MKLLLTIFALLALLVAIELQVGIVKGSVFPFAKEWKWSSLLHLMNYFGMSLMPLQVRVLEYVLQNAKQGDVDGIISKIDEFCWKSPTMNVGPVKGKLVDDALASLVANVGNDSGNSAQILVEFGSYLGYSTLRLAKMLKKTAPNAVLYSVDPNPLGHAIKTTLLQHAGLLGPQVRNELAYSSDVLKRLASEGKKIDFLFLDHIKELYLSDTQLGEGLGVFKPGVSLVVADNVVSPGAPEYRAWMLANKNFETDVHKTLLEYTHHTPDEVLVSKFKR